jgi:hypothetical protein
LQVSSYNQRDTSRMSRSPAKIKLSGSTLEANKL